MKDDHDVLYSTFGSLRVSVTQSPALLGGDPLITWTILLALITSEQKRQTTTKTSNIFHQGPSN